jgi:RimJ/RimL family protein N-acetyltransferase
MKYFKQLIGNRIYLTPPSLEDAPKYCEWLNNLEITINLQTDWSVYVEKERELLQDLLEKNNKIFGIVDKSNDTLIGSCGLHDIDYINGGAQFGIFIGDKTYHNKGIGLEAANLVLDFGFNILNLFNIYLIVYSYNTQAIKCYNKAGFHEVGKRRQIRQINGKRYDIIYMDILRTEFTSPYIDTLFKK